MCDITTTLFYETPKQPSLRRPTNSSLLGQTPSPQLINSLLASRSDTKQGVNFTQFLSMMGEHLFQLDPEHELKEAFACFDEGDKGYVSVSEMRKALAEMGDRMDDAEVGVASLASRRGWVDDRAGWS